MFASLQCLAIRKSEQIGPVIFSAVLRVSALLQRRLDEVAKLADLQRKQQERNFRLAYD